MIGAGKEQDGLPASNVVAFRVRRAEAAKSHFAGTIVVVMPLAIFVIVSAYLVTEASTALAVLDRHYAIAYLGPAGDMQTIGR